MDINMGIVKVGILQKNPQGGNGKSTGNTDAATIISDFSSHKDVLVKSASNRRNDGSGNGSGHRKWSKEVVYDRIMELYSEGKKLNPASLRNEDCGLEWALRHYFGSYDKAMEAMGIDPSEHKVIYKWTKLKIIRDLRKRHASGKDISPTSIINEDLKLYAAMYRGFDSYDNAMIAAGFDPGQYRVHASIGPVKVVQDILNLHLAGEDMSPISIMKHSPNDYVRMISVFGSYDNAMMNAGFRIYETRTNGKLLAYRVFGNELRTGAEGRIGTDEAAFGDASSCLAILESVFDAGLACGKPIVGTPFGKALEAHFGSIENACNKAGLVYSPDGKITREILSDPRNIAILYEKNLSFLSVMR